MFKSRGKAYAGWADVAIELERRHGPTERTKFVQSPYGTWSREIFRKASLNGPIEIRIEDGSTTPKTALGQRASIEHLSQLGLIDKANADQAYAIFQKFGALYLAPSLDAAVKSCLREQDMFKRWVEGGLQGPPPLIRKPWHNDQVHLQENQKWMNTDEVIELIALAEQMAPGIGPMIEEILGLHLQEHAQALMAQQMMQAGGQPGQPGQPDAGGGSNALRSSNRESGQPPEPPQPGAA
jgi:hypothetical protein